jgi:nitroreductase
MSTKPSTDFLQLVSEARTCRRYDASKELPAGTLDWLVDCARLTPSASNAQVLRYITVQAPKTREKLYPALGWAAQLKEWGGPIEKERPTGYIVVLSGKGPDGKVSAHSYLDAGIAAQTIQLAAWSKGIGMCIFRNFNPKVISDVVTVPADLEIVLTLALGFAVEERRLVPVGPDGSVKYYRDDKGVHYVPKRLLKDVLLGKY